jgi:hypothetical protein
MCRLRFENLNELPINIQIDPFAGLYVLAKGDCIEIEGVSTARSPRITIDEYEENRIVTLIDYNEYFVIRGEERIPWTNFPTNLTE